MIRNNWSRVAILVGGLMLSFMAPAAIAYDWNVTTAHVTVLEASYMPNYISFEIDQNAGTSCPSGSFLIWSPPSGDEQQQIANVNAVYSTLLTALASGKTVQLFGNNAGCNVVFVHIVAG
jgi:hypothetical protein